MTSKLLQSVQSHISERADLAAHNATEAERAAHRALYAHPPTPAPFLAFYMHLRTLAPSIAGQVEATVNRAVSLAAVAGWLDGWECGRNHAEADPYRAALAAIDAEWPAYAALGGMVASVAPDLAEDCVIAADLLIGAVAIRAWEDGRACAVDPSRLVFAQDGAE